MLSLRVDYLGMVNILGGREVVKELLQEDCNVEAVTAEVMKLVASPESRVQLQRELEELTAPLTKGGASCRAAPGRMGGDSGVK